MQLKSFLCTAVKGMLRAKEETAVTAFYHKKLASQPPQKATVSAARKLSGEIWKILTFEVPYREEDADLTERKKKRMEKVLKEVHPKITPEELTKLVDRLSGKTQVLQRLQEETGEAENGGSDAG